MSKKAKAKKATDPNEASKLIAAKISQLELDAAGEKDQEAEIGVLHLFCRSIVTRPVILGVFLKPSTVPRNHVNAYRNIFSGAWRRRTAFRALLLHQIWKALTYVSFM